MYESIGELIERLEETPLAPAEPGVIAGQRQVLRSGARVTVSHGNSPDTIALPAVRGNGTRAKRVLVLANEAVGGEQLVEEIVKRAGDSTTPR